MEPSHTAPPRQVVRTADLAIKSADISAKEKVLQTFAGFSIA